MKNVSLLTKLRRLSKSITVSVAFLLVGVGGSSFTNSSSPHNDKKSGRDSTSSSKGFPGLFPTDYNEAGIPYSPLLNPGANAFVQKFIQENSNRLNKMKVWGKPYFDIFDGILAQHGLPKELKYVSVVESSLVQRALSPVGAGGPWQIMAVEARSLGLKVNSKVDERQNYYKSTHAAARFMKDLYRNFHDWLLVIAAYNCGPGRLRQAIKKSGSTDFWVLQKYLPLETRNHVKKFIGTHYVFEGSGGLTTMTAAEIADYTKSVSDEDKGAPSIKNELGTTEVVGVSGKFKSAIIARTLDMDLQSFNRYNPGFEKLISQGKVFNLKLPADKMVIFEKKKDQILDESVKSMIN